MNFIHQAGTRCYVYSGTDAGLLVNAIVTQSKISSEALSTGRHSSTEHTFFLQPEDRLLQILSKDAHILMMGVQYCVTASEVRNFNDCPFYLKVVCRKEGVLQDV
jgi:hypothetical protein